MQDEMTVPPTRHVALGSLGSFSRGRGGTKADARDTGVPCIRYGDLYTRHDAVVRSFASFIDLASVAKYTALTCGDVVFAASGETHAEIGKAAVFVGSELACAGADTIIFHPRRGVDPTFIGYAVNTESAARFKSRFGQGSSVIHISARHLGDIPLDLPPLPEQRRIAEILDTLDEAIRKTEQVIAKLRQMKEGLLHDLLTRGIDEHGELRDPDRHPEQFKDSPLGRIPRGWEVVRFGECLSGSPQNGLYKPSRYYGVNGTPIVRIDGFYEGVLAPVSTMKRLRLATQESETYGLEPENILINRVNSIDFVGKAALVPQLPEPVVFESNMMRCRLLLDRLHPKFAIRWLTGSHARRWFYRRAKSAIAQASVNQGDVTALRVALPRPDEQKRAVVIAEGVEQRIESEREQLDKLRTLKHGLMDDLLTGRVRVTALAEATA